MHVDLTVLIMILVFASYLNPRQIDKSFRRNRKPSLGKEAIRHKKRNRFGFDRAGNMAECCPSRKTIIEPLGGISKTGKILELYRDSNTTQKFYQISCKSHYRNKPCRFLNHRVRRRSSCIQQYSYTYALVRELNSVPKQSWRMDYIRLKNGCSCVVKKSSSSVT